MSIIIRLQNLPWSANSVDIRRFFAGQSIPEGGVHIVGGEMGDAFIAFSTDEDARLAMAKDGGKIKDMQIRLLLSSRTEMMRVIEQARQQNTVLAQPPPPQVHQMMMPQVQQAPPLQHSARGQPEPPAQDRRRDRSPRHRSRDRSPSRDRRRSEDGRRRDSKRDRSRSPRGRSPRRDDRRGRDDRSKRDDRRYDDSRYRDDRRREEPEPKKVPDGERPQKGEGFRDIQQVYDAVQNIAMSGLFQYGAPPLGPQGAAARSIHDSAGAASPAQALFASGPFADPGAQQGGAEQLQQQQAKARRRTRFEPDTPQQPSYPEAQGQSSAYSIKRTEDRGGAWGAGAQPANSVTPNGDFVQVVEMDIDPPEADSLIETGGSSYPSPHAPAGQGPSRDSPLRGGDPRGQHAYGDALSRVGLMPPQADANRAPTSRGHNSDGYNSGPPPNSQSRIPSSLAVEVKGLPPDASITDILDLFRGISLPAANIRIEASERGFEAAYIRFTSAADFQEAMNRNRHFAKEGRCQLVPCPESAFEGASRGPPRGEPHQRSFKPRPRPREEDLIVQLRGLPFSCTDDNVVKFFDGLSVLDIYIERADDGRASGIGYVEFGSHKDFREALVYNGKMIGHRYITISVGSKDMMQAARNHGRPPRDYDSDSRPNHGAPHHPPSAPPRPALLPSSAPAGAPSGGAPRQPPFCVFLKNLPDDVTNRHIAEFLNQAQVMPRAIHIMLRPDSQRPSGEAYAEFASPANMDAALKLSGQPMSGKPVQIAPISYFEMCDILGRPAQPPPAEGGLLRPPNLMERPRGPLLPQGPRDRPPRMDFPPRGMRPRMDGPPGRPRMDGPPGRPPLFGGPGRVRGPWPNRPPRFEGGRPSVDRGPKDFGSPGCVVAISNLHFKAGLEELLDFFKGFTVSKDNIIRKYNENGQTTGEARVAFPTPQEAQKVVAELNRKTIMGRSLNLSIV